MPDTFDMENTPDIFPDIFIDYQKIMMTSVFANPVVIYEKSRRIGITWAVAALAVLVAGMGKSAGGMDVFYMGYNLEMAREFIVYCAFWAKRFNQAISGIEESFFVDDKNPEKSIKIFRIKFASGYEILALPSSARSLRGKQGLAIVDEAAFHDDLEAVIKAAIAFLMWGGKVLIISSHHGEDSEFNNLVQDIRGGKKPYILLRTDLDDALKDGLYKRICLTEDKEWSAAGEAKWRQELIDFYDDDADEELFCIPSKSSGTYFPSELLNSVSVSDIPMLRLAKSDSFSNLPKHMQQAEIKDWLVENLEPLLADLNPMLPTAFGSDFGRSGDLSVNWPLQMSSGMVANTPFLVELHNIPFEIQKMILFFMLDRLPRFIGGAMDAGGNGAFLAEVANQRYGNIEEIKFSTEWYRQNMPKYKSAMEDKTITLPRDQDVLGDHRLVVMEGGVAKVPQGKRRKGMNGKYRHGDAAIAGALAYYAISQKTFDYEYMPVQKNIAADDFNAERETRSQQMAMHADDQYNDNDDNNFGDGAY